MNDALEILDELDYILASNKGTYEELVTAIYDYVEQKRTEFQPSCGDCAS